MDQEVEFKGKTGTALASLIPDWAVSFKGKCSCKDWEKKMNGWGPDLCDVKEREAIVGHLVSQSEHLIPTLASLPLWARRLGANKMLDKAIKMSRQK
jgi:hypothetical protein